MMEFLFDESRAIVDLIFSGVLARYPRVQIVVTHSGGVLPLLVDRVDLLKMASKDLAATDSARKALAHLWFDCAGTPFPATLPALLPLSGYERLFYGSDYCFTPAIGLGLQIGSLDGAGHPLAGQWRELTTSNAERLLDRRRSENLVGGFSMARRRIRTTLFRWLAGALVPAADAVKRARLRRSRRMIASDDPRKARAHASSCK